MKEIEINAVLSEYINQKKPFLQVTQLAKSLDGQGFERCGASWLYKRLKEDYRMKYRKASGKNALANTFENKTLRSIFATQLLNNHFRDIEIWNIVKSSIVSSDTRTRGWLFHWETGNF